MDIKWSICHRSIIRLFVFCCPLLMMGCATAAPVADNEMISVISIKQGIEDNYKEHPDAKFCKDFNMTKRDVKNYFQVAKAIEANERHHQFSWSLCYVNVSIKKEGIVTQWKLFASGVAEKISEKPTVLGCKECGAPFFNF
jgi:hypothetical protein